MKFVIFVVKVSFNSLSKYGQGIKYLILSRIKLYFFLSLSLSLYIYIYIYIYIYTLCFAKNLAKFQQCVPDDF
jgi:hypothetical protein